MMPPPFSAPPQSHHMYHHNMVQRPHCYATPDLAAMGVGLISVDEEQQRRKKLLQSSSYRQQATTIVSQSMSTATCAVKCDIDSAALKKSSLVRNGSDGAPCESPDSSSASDSQSLNSNEGELSFSEDQTAATASAISNCNGLRRSQTCPNAMTNGEDCNADSPKLNRGSSLR